MEFRLRSVLCRHTVLALSRVSRPPNTIGGCPMFVALRTMAAVCTAAGVLTVTMPAQALVRGAWHILALPHYYETTGQLPPGGGDGPMYYYGGFVFSTRRLLFVILGGQGYQPTIDEKAVFSGRYGEHHHRPSHGAG